MKGSAELHTSWHASKSSPACCPAGVKPGTTVFYKVGDPKHGWSPMVYNFTVLPDNFPFTVSVMADSGQSYNTSDTLASLLQPKRKANMLWNVGDLSYAGKGWRNISQPIARTSTCDTMTRVEQQKPAQPETLKAGRMLVDHLKHMCTVTCWVAQALCVFVAVPSADNINTFGTYACWLRAYFDAYPQYSLYQFDLASCPQEPPEVEESAETCERRYTLADTCIVYAGW